MISLDQLNSLTKYPSIPTYHTMDRGKLLENRVSPDVPNPQLIVTEKIDGTNSRIILMPTLTGDEDSPRYFIGSREELLTAQGDVIYIPTMGIVDNLRGLAEHLLDYYQQRDHVLGYTYLRVFYLETYGGKIGRAAKQYSSDGQYGYRLFDHAEFNLAALAELNLPLESISGWRENNVTPHRLWTREPTLQSLAEKLGLELSPRIPTSLETYDELPETHEDTLRWLEEILPQTRVALDDATPKKPEGVVVRDPYRRFICKIRYEDYHKTLRRK